MALVAEFPSKENPLVKVYQRDQFGKPRFEVCWRAEGERKRKTFTDQQAASSLAQKLSKQIKSNSGRFHTITAAEYRLLEKAKQLGESEIDAALGKVSDLSHRCTVSELKDRFLSFYDHRAKRTRDDVRTRFAQIEDTFGDRYLDSITTHEIESWYLSLPVATRTKNNFLTIFTTFMNLARDWEYLPHDRTTAAARVRRVQTLKKEPGILTLEEATAILKTADIPLLPYITLGLFAGLRPSESAGVIGERDGLLIRDIDLEKNVIRIRRPVAGKVGRPRVIDIQPNLKKWLSPLLNGDPDSPACFRTSYTKFSEANLAHEWKIPWTIDAMRHSFISYYFALTGEKGRTAQQAGNSERVIDEDYNNPRSKAEAEAWFSLTPETVGRPLGRLGK